MNISLSSTSSPFSAVLAPPWHALVERVQEALADRKYFIASAEELGALWHGERIDATERRRRISVFAAQHRWKVEAREDGRAARFQSSAHTPHSVGEILSRNHE